MICLPRPVPPGLLDDGTTGFEHEQVQTGRVQNLREGRRVGTVLEDRVRWL